MLYFVCTWIREAGSGDWTVSGAGAGAAWDSFSILLLLYLDTRDPGPGRGQTLRPGGAAPAHLSVVYFVTRKASAPAWSWLITQGAPLTMQMGPPEMSVCLMLSPGDVMRLVWSRVKQAVRVRLGLGCVRCGWPGPDQVPPPSPHFFHRREKRGATGQRRQLSLSWRRLSVGVINTLCPVCSAAGARDLLCGERSAELCLSLTDNAATLPQCPTLTTLSIKARDRRTINGWSLGRTSRSLAWTLFWTICRIDDIWVLTLSCIASHKYRSNLHVCKNTCGPWI